MSLTVGELLKHLRGLDPKTLIVMASDSEGNELSVCSCVSPAPVIRHQDWVVEMVDEGEERGDLERALILWPAR